MSGFTNIEISIPGEVPPLTGILLLSANNGAGGSTTTAVFASFNNGLTWTNLPTPLVSQFFSAMAFSATRKEVLFLSATGTILRTTDGVNLTNLVNDIGNQNWLDIERDDANGLYVAVGSAGQISTSPTGATWTPRVSGLATQLVVVALNSVTGILVAGTSSANVKPFVWSSDGGLTWNAPTNAYAGARTMYEFANSAAGRYLFGDRGSVTPSHSTVADGPFTVDTNLVSGQTAAAYDPVHDLAIMCTGGSGINTSPASGAMAYTQRTGVANFDSVEDMIWQSAASQLIGIRPPSGGVVVPQIITSSNGTTYAANSPVSLPATSTFSRIIEAFF